MRALLHEIELVASQIKGEKRVAQLHFGGGTPTQLSIEQIALILEKISLHFCLAQAHEIAIEIDPRTVADDGGEKLRGLKALGFNRVSFGVQDTEGHVQEAVRRRQSLEMTQETYFLARELGLRAINIDLIYGLPYQTVATFDNTIGHILQMRPDRIALFSYANVPWLKPHQKAIRQDTLPSTEEKFAIYAHARQAFVENGYTAIGMDHFALKDDEMAIAYRTKRLQRNFQGYSLKLAEQMIGLGMSSIGFVNEGYFQNKKELGSYYAALDKGLLPIHAGKLLSVEDRLRKWVIHTIMCDFALDKQDFEKRFDLKFDSHFANCTAQLQELEKNGLVQNSQEKIQVTPLGELFVRNIAMSFDGYLNQPALKARFSQSI